VRGEEGEAVRGFGDDAGTPEEGEAVRGFGDEGVRGREGEAVTGALVRG
jgi:hypothetical protein